MYVELHARSSFSFLEGASNPEELVETCAALDMPAMALVDTDNLCGAPRFYMAAKKAGIKALIGAEITAEAGGRYVLLVENRTGYQNLCRLITSMKMRSEKGKAAASEEEFHQYAGGLICLTRGEHNLETLLRIYGRHNVFIELQRHFDREQEARNQRLIDMARKHRLPLLATNGVRFAHPSKRELMDVLTCIRHKVTIDQAGRLLERNAERYLKPAGEMRYLFAGLPEALCNTVELAARLDFTLADLGYRFPPYPVPPGETMNSFLRKRVEEGARLRYRPYHERARKQIERELQLIEKLDLAGYFLIVWDIVRFCRENNILAQGRGSAANSAVCYSLGITAVDPVGMDLLFERFLSEERGEWPDIDIDLPSGSQRERVIQYVYQRYGKHGAAMTANVITYRDRSALRDVGKALGFPQQELNRLASLVSRWGFKDPNNDVNRQFAEAGCDLNHPQIRKFQQLYLEIQDLPRHLGQHSGGMVICQGSLDSVVPLEPATMPGRVVIQWDKEDCADLGLIKVDLLGLGMLAAIEDCIQIIRTSYGKEIDLAHLPQNDPSVFDQITAADTVGLFQVESRAQMASLPLTKPQTFYDLVVQVAIIRPGPIVGKMYHPYVRRRQGLEPPVSLHPSLDQVLARTLGVPLFQEQLLKMAMIVADFTGGEAEELRRAMGFKRSEKRMKEIEARLRAGMTKKGITGPQQEAIVQSITSFALYGFPESHAASFALIAYASAWLRRYYPAAYAAALLNAQPMGFYHPLTLLKDAQRHGVRVLPVDVAFSDWKCTVENGMLRLGLNYVRGLPEEAGRAIVAQRTKQPFQSVFDLVQRVPELNREHLRQLAVIGAFNSIGASHRRDALWQVELASKPVGPLLQSVEPQHKESPLRPMDAQERVNADLTGTGLTVGRHPVALHRSALKALGVLTAEQMRRARHGSFARIAGAVICRQRPETAKGFCFLSLEDETGIANAIVHPDLFERNRLLVVSEPFLLLEGTVQNNTGAVSLKVVRLQALHSGQVSTPSHDFY
ncbi:MAG: error-prone DNA polymerase [Bryobacteraceae bacterium]|nr:error-prone DNA polymerase [Bryobacteraceae bacterium]MDW8380041.1 error-prone DNA polymerase [Bryobacterales bacterium]